MSKRKRGFFVANGGDHCETPTTAYTDVAPFVTELARQILPPCTPSKDKAEITPDQQLRARISLYDPYYCAGGALRRLAAIGFTRVYNRKEDFYAVLKKGKVPEHDLILSNPPFSADHPQRILHFACSSQRAHACGDRKARRDTVTGKEAGAVAVSGAASRCLQRPWLLLLPNHTMHQPWFKALMEQTGERPLFLCPASKYKFHAFYDIGNAKGSGADSARSAGEEVAPCHTLWYIGGLGDELRAHMVEWWRGRQRQKLPSGSHTTCTLAQSVEQLPRSLRKLDRYTKRKVERKQRLAKRKKQRQQQQ